MSPFFASSNSHGALIAYLDSKSFVVKIKRNDDTGKILIPDVTTDDTFNIWVDIYNAIIETDQINPLFHNVEKWPPNIL